MIVCRTKGSTTFTPLIQMELIKAFKGYRHSYGKILMKSHNFWENVTTKEIDKRFLVKWYFAHMLKSKYWNLNAQKYSNMGAHPTKRGSDHMALDKGTTSYMVWSLPSQKSHLQRNFFMDSNKRKPGKESKSKNPQHWYTKANEARKQPYCSPNNPSKLNHAVSQVEPESYILCSTSN